MEMYKKYIIINAVMFTIFGILLFIFFLPLIKKLNYGQSIRSLGPKKHLKKSGTPLIKSLFIIVPIVLYGIIGFIDDYLIIIKKNNNGIKPTIKFISQLIIAVIIYFVYLSIYKTNELNFFGIYVDLKFFYGILM